MPLTTNLINMIDTYVLTDEKLVLDPIAALKKFRSQVQSPNFDVDYKQIITDPALVIIRYTLATMLTEVGMTYAETTKWPVKADNSRYTLRQMSETLIKVFGQEENPLTIYDLDKSLKEFTFKFSFKEKMKEANSWKEFFDLLKSFYGYVETNPQDRQDEICKVFYKKLPLVDNDFTRRF